MIEMNDISKVYQSGTKALDSVNLSLEGNQFISLVGENGAGKTTFVRILSSLLSPSSGTATICDFDVVKDKSEVRKIIGYQGQNMLPSFNYRLNGYESLEYYATLKKIPHVDIEEQIEFFIKQFKIDFLDKLYIQLSGGQRQLLSLCRAILNYPKVLFLDEPTAHLDPMKKKRVLNFLEKYSEENLVMMTSHDLVTIEKYTDYLIFIKNGSILDEGDFQSVMQKYTNLIVLEISNSENTVNKKFSNFRDGLDWISDNIDTNSISRSTKILLRGANIDSIYEEIIGDETNV